MVAELAEQIDPHGGDYDPGLYAPEGSAATVPGPLRTVSADLRQQYGRDGFLAVDALIGTEQVTDAIAGIDRLIGGGAPGFRGIQWEGSVRARLPELELEQRRRSVRKLVYYVDHEPRLHAIAHHPAILGPAAELLGSEPELFADQALLKPPGIGREKPWHQDVAYFDVRPGAPVVGIWIALDDTDPDNGCMHVIPGSHRAGPVPHFNRRDFQLCDTDVDRQRVIAVPLPPGGCLIFDGLLHHGTPRNTSDRRRWALQFHYAPTEAIWKSRQERAAYKESRLAVFGGDGLDVTC